LLAFTLALFSKASVVFFPLALLAVSIVLPASRQYKPVQWYVLGLMLVLSFGAIFLHYQIAVVEGIIQADLPRMGVLDPGMTIQRALLIPAYYFYRFILPWPLNIFLDEVALIANFSNVIVALILLTTYLSTVIFAWRYRRISILPFIGLTWFYIALGPVSNILPTSPMIAERYIFPGLFGLSLLSATVLIQVIKPGVRRNAFIVLLSAWVLTVMFRGPDWRSDQDLYASAFASSPSIAAYPYVISLINNREHDQLTELINSRHIPVYLRELALGEVAAQKGEYGQALSHLKKAKYYGAA